MTSLASQQLFQRANLLKKSPVIMHRTCLCIRSAFPELPPTTSTFIHCCWGYISLLSLPKFHSWSRCLPGACHSIHKFYNNEQGFTRKLNIQQHSAENRQLLHLLDTNHTCDSRPVFVAELWNCSSQGSTGSPDAGEQSALLLLDLSVAFDLLTPLVPSVGLSDGWG